MAAERRRSRFESHAFEGPEDAARSARCTFCGYPRVSILHHPSRVRAALAIAGEAQQAQRPGALPRTRRTRK